MIGQVFGRYRVVAKLGEGGMGVVYRANDEVLHRDVALKVLSKGAVPDEATRDYLLHEARASSALSHPNVCTIYEVAEFDGGLCIVMELVEGKPLSALLAGGGLAVESILRYGVQVAAALAHSHGRGVIHRDLKSSNIVATPQGLIKVLDFGLARRIDQDLGDGRTQTSPAIASLDTSAGFTGTLQYMAPEIFRGEEGDHRSDLWALGVVLYEAASGKLPFRGRTSFELGSSILNELPPPLPSHIPLALWAVIQRCLAKEPAHRYQQAAEVQAALEALQSATIISENNPADPRGFRTTVLRGMRHLQVKDGDALLLVGTTKGAFLLRSRPDRASWTVAGPYFHGQAIYSMAYDGRNGRHRLWASTHSPVWGALLRSTDDFGRTWTNPLEANIKFPADAGLSVKNIWQICIGRESEPGKLYCGVEPAALFESGDAGESWSLVRGLFDHPHRPRWAPGNGGLCLHTILPDPANHNRMYIAISAGGVYRTDDAGKSWQARNSGIRVVFAPERYPEFGQCVHKVALHPSFPDRLFLQSHWGLYRSDDGAETWQDIANGVPSDFGFPIVAHPHNPSSAYILPVESDEFRCTPNERLRVYRTRNAGASWEPLCRGLPQKGAYVTVLRDAMTADSLHPAGIYFGTRSGDLYASADEGKTWKKILDGLPPICCVKSAVVGPSRAAQTSSAARKPPASRRKATPPAPRKKLRRTRR
jgi:serine/threonine protein kinase